MPPHQYVAPSCAGNLHIVQKHKARRIVWKPTKHKPPRAVHVTDVYVGVPGCRRSSHAPTFTRARRTRTAMTGAARWSMLCIEIAACSSQFLGTPVPGASQQTMTLLVRLPYPVSNVPLRRCATLSSASTAAERSSASTCPLSRRRYVGGSTNRMSRAVEGAVCSSCLQELYGVVCAVPALGFRQPNSGTGVPTCAASACYPTASNAQACHKCVIIKPAGDFYRNRTNRDGLYNNCKKCFADNSARRQQHLPPMEQRMAEQKVCLTDSSVHQHDWRVAASGFITAPPARTVKPMIITGCIGLTGLHAMGVFTPFLAQ